jgi:hypothetical protein
MKHMPSRAELLVGLVAIAGAFAAAATMSAAGAPTARADDFTDVINVADADFATAQTDFATALTDFSSANVPAGLTLFLDGADTDLLGAPENLVLGTVDVLTNQSVASELDFSIVQPTSLADALAASQSAVTTAEGFMSQAATLFGAGDYADGLYDSFVGSDYSALSLDYLVIGGAEALGL